MQPTLVFVVRGVYFLLFCPCFMFDHVSVSAMGCNTITGLRRYRIPPSEANILRRKAVRRNGIAAVVSFIVPIVANEWRRSHKLPLPSDINEAFLFTVFFVPVVALLVSVIWRNIEKARASVDKLLSVEIVVDDTSVSRRQPGIEEIK